MKKHLFVMGAAVMLCTSAFAQSTTPNTFKNDGGLYVKGGLNLANISTSSNGSVSDGKTYIGFNVGLMDDIPLAQGFSFQPGIYFTSKGSKTTYGQSSDTYHGDYKFNPMYVEFAPNFVGKIPLAGDAAILIGAGPYVAMGVAGKYKTSFTTPAGTSETSESIKWSKDDPTTSEEEGEGIGKLKRFDFGANFLAGVEVGLFQISANYGLGLTKINSVEDNNNDKNKHRVWSVNLAFRL